MLIYLIDITEDDPLAVYYELRTELEQFDPKLATRPALIALSKVDLLPDQAAQAEARGRFENPPQLISAVSGAGIPHWIRAVYELQNALRMEEDQIARELAEEDET